MTPAWVLLALGLAGCGFLVGYAVLLRRKYARAARAATLLRDRIDDLKAILVDWELRRGD